MQKVTITQAYICAFIGFVVGASVCAMLALTQFVEPFDFAGVPYQNRVVVFDKPTDFVASRGEKLTLPKGAILVYRYTSSGTDHFAILLETQLTDELEFFSALGMDPAYRLERVDR